MNGILDFHFTLGWFVENFQSDVIVGHFSSLFIDLRPESSKCYLLTLTIVASHMYYARRIAFVDRGLMPLGSTRPESQRNLTEGDNADEGQKAVLL